VIVAVAVVFAPDDRRDVESVGDDVRLVVGSTSMSTERETS
jgi:hypothetical protein